MSPVILIVHDALLKHSPLSANQIAASIAKPIEDVYEALVELDSAGLAYIATQSRQPRRSTGNRDRLWRAAEGVQ